MILTLLRGNDMEHETLGNIGNTSKAEILRAFVTEKLTAAAQEILAVVERTVAGYEEEVSGLRQEADRHRSQLEVLLQTEIKVEATDPDEQQLFPACEPVQEEASAGGAGDRPEEEEQQQQQHKNESVSYGPLRDLCLGPPWTLGQGHLHPLTPPDGRSAQIMTSGAGTVHKGVEDDGDVGVPRRTGGESSERAAPISAQVQDRLSEPGSETAPRSLPPTVQSDRRSAARSRISETQTHVDLRVRMLKDSNIEVLSTSVFKKCPMQELQCPRGLQEADFLDLLRSRFPQLRPDKPFDVFTTDRSRRLQPLTVQMLTPEEIYRSIRSTGNSALYIRLKTREEPQTQGKDAAAADSPSATDHPTLNTRLLSPRVKSDRKSTSRLPVGAAETHVDLRIRILEDLHLNVLTPMVFRKCRLWELQCPRGLQEADFLDLLRSRFPQLGPDKLFDFFISDRHRTLQPLTAQTLTPEEIFRAAGNSVLFIRLKPLEKVQTNEEDLTPQRKPPPAPDQTRVNTSVQPDGKKSGRSRISDTQNQIDLRFRILEDSQISVLSTRVFKKCPVLELQCPRGLQEADFLHLLRSSFPQLRPDKPFDIFTTDRSRKLLPLRVETLTPEEIYRSINLNKNIVLLIRLKAQEEKLDLLPSKADAAKVSPSVPAETRLHTRTTVQRKGKTRMDFLHDSPAREDRETEGGDDSVGPELSGLWSLQPLLLSESERDENEVNDEDWKPDESNGKPRNKEPENTIRRRHSSRSGFQTEGKPIQASPRVLAGNGDTRPSCKVCGTLRGSASMVIRHAWSHVNDPERLCGVCGEHSKSAEELMSHLQSHQKTHSCNICGKSFLSTSGLSGHIARHKGEKPYKCKICHKAFAEKSVLTNHKWVHTVEKPHKCDICQKSCISKIRLKHHLATHSGKKPYSCNTCSKPLSSLKTLSQHMLTHAVRTAVRERPHGCEICKKRFFTNYRLQIHMRRHEGERPKGSRAIVASV